MRDDKKFLVAQLGRAVGLKGEMKLNLHTDFPEQFKKGVKLLTSRGEFEIENYNKKRGLIKLKGIDTPEDAKLLTNSKIYISEEETRKNCILEQNQYFWFDIIGLTVIEEGEILGKVKDILRLPQADYLEISTDETLIKSGMPKSFLLPYLPNFISKVDTQDKKIFVTKAKDILEAS
jgi:16S rRNA processing protein RimM